MADVSSDHNALAGILVPGLWCVSDNLWSGASSYTQAGPRPGVAEPQQQTDLALETSGTQAAGTSLQVRVQRAGNPARDAGAGIVYKESTDVLWRGWDPPRFLSAWEAIVWTDSSPATIDPHVGRLTTGEIVCAYQRTVAGVKTVQARHKTATGAWSSEIEVYAGGDNTGSFRLHPCVVPLADGSCLILHWVYGDNDDAQVRVHCSTDQGATWIVASRYALESVLDVSTTAGSAATGFQPGRLRAAEAAGQILLMAQVQAKDTDLTYRETYKQYASISSGLSFELVETGSSSDEQNFGYQEVLSDDGSTFKVLFMGGSTTAGSGTDEDGVYLRALESAYQGFNAAWGDGDTVVAATYEHATQTSSLYTDGDLGAWVDEDGILYCVLGDFSTSTRGGNCLITRSVDGGATWAGMGESVLGGDFGLWWRGDSTTYPVNLCGTSQAGRGVVLHNWEAGTANEDDSLGCAYLGGYSTITLPGQILIDVDTRRQGFEFVSLPIELPEDSGHMTLTTAGTATRACTAGTDGDGVIAVTTTTGTSFVYDNPTGAVEKGMHGRLVRLVNSGGATSDNSCAYLVRLADGSTDHQVVIRYARNGSNVDILVRDIHGASQIGSTINFDTSNDEMVDILFGFKKNTGDTLASFSLWYATYDAKSPVRVYRAGPTTASVTEKGGSPAANNLVQVGAIASGTTDFEDKIIQYNFDGSGGLIGENLADGQTNPDDLFTRPLGARPVYVHGGTKVRGVGGPGKIGDVFNINTRYDYAAERVFPGVEPSPRTGWRSTGVGSAQRFALYLEPDLGSTSGQESRALGDALGIYLAGLNWETGLIEGYRSGSWSTLYDFQTTDGELSQLGWTRHGNTIVPASGGNQNPFLLHNEFRSGYFKLSSSVFRKIRRHGEGKWNPGSGRLVPHLILEDVDSGDPTSGTTGAILPPQCLLIVHLQGQDYNAFRVTVDAQNTAEGDLRIGTLAAGAFNVSGPTPSPGTGRSRVSGVTRQTSRDRQSRATLQHPSYRRTSVAWPEPHWMGWSDVEDPSPDTVKLYTSGTIPVAAWGTAAATLEGVMQAIEDAPGPVLFCDWLLVGTDATLTINRPRHLLWGWMGGEVSWSDQYRVLGSTTRLVTVGSVGFEEQP